MFMLLLLSYNIYMRYTRRSCFKIINQYLDTHNSCTFEFSHKDTKINQPNSIGHSSVKYILYLYEHFV